MDPADKMGDHLAKVVAIAQRLKDMDMEPKDPFIAKILSSLPERYDNTRTACYAVPRDQQTLEKLTDHMVNEETLLNMHKQTSVPGNEEETYYARGKRFVNKHNKSRDNVSSSNDNNKRLWAHNNSDVKRGNCHICKRPGYFARECYDKKAYIERKRQDKIHSLLSESSRSNDNDAAVMFNVETTRLSDYKVDDLRFANSGSSEHLCLRRDWYKSFESFKNHNNKVKVGDGNVLIAKGILTLE